MDLNSSREPARAPSSPTTEPIDEMMRTIRRSFIDGLDRRILAIETNWSDVKSGRQVAVAFETVGNEVHRIAGIAASLGFHDVGHAARQLDQALQATDAASGAKCLISEHDSALERFLDMLEATLD